MYPQRVWQGEHGQIATCPKPRQRHAQPRLQCPASVTARDGKSGGGLARQLGAGAKKPVAVDVGDQGLPSSAGKYREGALASGRQASRRRQGWQGGRAQKPGCQSSELLTASTGLDAKSSA